MPTASQIKTYLTQSVLPILAGAASNWLIVHLHFLAAFHITSQSVAGEITQLGVFGISAGITWLTGHHILKGTYGAAPAITPVTWSTSRGNIAQVKPVPMKLADPAPSPVTVNVHPAAAPTASATPVSAPAAPPAASEPPPAVAAEQPATA